MLARIKQINLWGRKLLGSYKEIYQSWKEDQLKFWQIQSEGIDWEKKPTKNIR